VLIFKRIFGNCKRMAAMIIRGKRAQLETRAAWIVSEAVQTLLETKSKMIVAVQVGVLQHCILTDLGVAIS
jgi:hypothetical protein